MNVSWYKNEIQPEKNWAQLKESTVLSFQELTEVDRTQSECTDGKQGDSAE